jgi:hypothetical protein
MDGAFLSIASPPSAAAADSMFDGDVLLSPSSALLRNDRGDCGCRAASPARRAGAR